jgi:hypothetical protein
VTTSSSSSPPPSPPPSLQRPDHLDPPRLTGGPAAGAWILAHAAGLVALLLGTVSFIVVTVSQREFWSQPNWRLTIPFFVVTLVATVVAFVRKEKTYALPLLGLGLAAATLVLGWFFVFLSVVVGAAILIAILGQVS